MAIASITEQTTLVGRDGEVQALQQAYRRSVKSASTSNDETNTSDLVLIRGHSGTGKTALANSLRSSVENDDGYFLSGKFELTSTLATPYAAFAVAFTQFTDQLLQTNSRDKERLSKMKNVIRNAIGSEGRLLVSIIPALEKIVEIPQDDESERQGPEALRRFQFLFCQLCLAVSTVAPIVLFLDDLQWCDTASLQLIQALLQSRDPRNKRNSSLLLVGSYRDEGVDDKTVKASNREIFLRYLSEIHSMAESTKLSITNIRLQNLAEDATLQLVADSLDIPIEATTEIGQAVFSACQGNPLHALQILNDLLRKSFDSSYKLDGTLKWSDPRILRNASWAESIDELFRRKFTSLPILGQTVLQVAACMGDEIDESAVAMVLDEELPDIASALRVASDEGHCVLDGLRGRYCFTHDRSRQTALSTIGDKHAMFFQIGHKLWTKSSPLFLSTHKFIIANLLNCGLDKITERSEQYNAAAFYLEAGIEAASKADFPDSSRFLSAGMELMKGCGDYWKEQYSLSLKLFNAKIDTEVCLQNFDEVEGLVKEVLAHARTLHDKLTAHVAAINSFGQRGMIPQAVAIGNDILRQLGEPVPSSPTKTAIIWDVIKTKLALRGQTNDELLCLPPMNDINKLAAMHVLAVLIPYAYQTASFYTPLFGTRLVRTCLKHGMHKTSAFGFVTFAVTICGRDRQEAHRLGSLALSIVQRWRAKAILPRVHMLFYGLIHHWKFPLRDTLEPLHKAIQVAFETGDVEGAMIARYYECSNWLHSGVNLANCEKLLVESTDQMKIYKQDNMLQFTNVLLQFVQLLTGSACDPNAFADDVKVSEHEPILATYYVWGANLAFRLGDYELSNRLVERSNALNFKPFSQYGFSVRIQTEALLAVARARLGTITPRQACKIGKPIWKKIKSFEVDCPENFSFKRCMVEAELQTLTSNHHNQLASRKIISLYDKAVKDALEQGFTHEAALASELAGDFMDRQGNVTGAKTYWEQAHQLYLAWGAAQKAAKLVEKTRLHEISD